MTQRPLSRFPLARTTDPRSLRDAVDGLTGYEHSVHRSARPTSAAPGIVNGLKVGSLSLIYVAYAAPVSVLAPPTGEQILVVLPLGPMGVMVRETSWTMGTPFALSANYSTQMFPHPHAGALVGAIAKTEIQQAMRELFTSEDDFSIDLHHPRPINLHAGTHLHRMWVSLASEDRLTDDYALTDSLALGLSPHTRHTREHLVGQQPPPYLVSALQYLTRHFAEPISLGKLSEAVGISSRQLQLSFRAHLGCTAQEYLRNIRLDHAYRRLSGESGTSVATVADVATEVGIPHLGRFAQYFAQRYGKRPSDL